MKDSKLYECRRNDRLLAIMKRTGDASKSDLYYIRFWLNRLVGTIDREISKMGYDEMANVGIRAVVKKLTPAQKRRLTRLMKEVQQEKKGKWSWTREGDKGFCGTE